MQVFPTLIQNKVDYKHVDVPKYWGLSKNHENDYRQMIGEYYVSLRTFYDEKVLYNILNTITTRCEKLLLLADATPYLTKIMYKTSNTYSIFDKRISMLLFENYFLLALLEYIKLTKDDTMLVRHFNEGEGEGDDEEEIQKLLPSKLDDAKLQGEKKQLRMKTAQLLKVFLNIMTDHKKIVDLTYDKIMDVVFKSKEREKNTFTDRLKVLTDEERNVDTILKKNKLGVWGKGLQKGLTTYTQETYDEEREYMDKIGEVEKNLRKNKNVTDNNLEQYIDDYLEDSNNANNIAAEENDMCGFTDDYMDGDDHGQEEENYGDYE